MMSNSAESVTVRAPGRVNLIGEHTDYNGGMVLPMPLDKAITVTLSEKPGAISIASDQFEQSITRSIAPVIKNHWSDYIVATMAALQDQGMWHEGAEIVLSSTIPNGSGLSSSAALIVGILKAANTLHGHGLSETTIALLAQDVENNYLNVPCGIMDQMVISAGKPELAMALDTDSLEFELVEVFPDHEFIVCHSGIHRKLNDGRYAERRQECEEAAGLLGSEKLCLLSDQQLEVALSLPEPLNRRARHAATEHRRVLQAVDTLKQNNATGMGALMTASHDSLRDDFEVSVPEIDEIVDFAITSGALGARMTGGGFGGCIVSLVQSSKSTEWKSRITERFPQSRMI